MLFPNQPDSEARDLRTSVARATPHACSHAVHFYDDDALFLDSLGEFAGGALGSGGACVVVAAEPHRAGVAKRLSKLGIGVALNAGRGRYIALDAAEMLDKFMVDGWPDEQRFMGFFGPMLLRARGISGGAAPVVAYQEMAAQLFEKGRRDAAVYLEQLWKKLAARHDFQVRCAYPMRLFAGQADGGHFHRICDAHSDVIPSESYTRLGSNAERWRMVSSLQQQASTLRAAIESSQRETEERLRVEEQLRQSQAFAETVLDSSVDCVKVRSLEGCLEYMNAPGSRAMEISNIADVLGCPWAEFWRPEDRPRVQAAIAEAAAGSVGSFQGECDTFGGNRRTWDVKITPARNASGEIERLIAVSRDITELRLAQTAAMHAEKLATAGRMAATIAHEINNPLEAVTNFIYLALCDSNLPEQVRQNLQVADRELTRVAHIARQTLGFYRSTSTSRWIAVPEMVRDALMVYERRLRNKELQVQITVDPGLRVYGKEGELRQVLLNLTANAIDACRSGGKIWIRAQRARRWSSGGEYGVRFTLADNGAGMPRDVKRRLFSPFFTTKADVGTGLGLWVTKSLVEQRGGYVRFRSRQGERSGTAMSFFVPSPKAVEAAAA